MRALLPGAPTLPLARPKHHRRSFDKGRTTALSQQLGPSWWGEGLQPCLDSRSKGPRRFKPRYV
eukprot:9005364-Alexandrium_andersonii.AAC.1